MLITTAGQLGGEKGRGGVTERGGERQRIVNASSTHRQHNTYDALWGEYCTYGGVGGLVGEISARPMHRCHASQHLSRVVSAPSENSLRILLFGK